MGRRFTTLQTNFSSGELDRKIIGRRDLQKYFAGAISIKNGVVAPQGGVFRRWGLPFCSEVTKKLVKRHRRSYERGEGRVLVRSGRWWHFVTDPQSGLLELLDRRWRGTQYYRR